MTSGAKPGFTKPGFTKTGLALLLFAASLITLVTITQQVTLAQPTIALTDAQHACSSTPAWSTCDLAFDLEPGDNAAALQLRAEFQSPHHRTYLMYAFQDSERRFIIRVAPTEAGTWFYRLTSNLPRLDGKEGQFTATESDSPGFVRVANVHHFMTEGNSKQHLWMATALDHFATIPRAEFDRIVAQRAAEKFTHVRVTIERSDDLREAADRLRAINARGMTADLALSSTLPLPGDRAERQRYLTDFICRFAPMNLTWLGLAPFEDVAHGRAILKEFGDLLKKYDPYNHPRTTLASFTSAALLGDGWMTMLSYGTPDPNVGAVEHQLYQSPAIETGIKNERDLWMATMNGQYPASGSGEYMTAWFEFMAGNRYWELEPYFGVDGGRAIALEGIEYIVYIDKPGPVEVTVEHHGYDVAWINPANGERIKAKGYSGEHFTGEAPDKSHPWVLHISREGTKEGMLKSYKFESRTVPVQEVEQSPEKTPFEIALPDKHELSISHPPYFAIKVKRESRATRSLLIEWTAEAVVHGEGYRVVGVGREGTMQVSPLIASDLPAVGTLRMSILNANGKAYVVDKVVSLVP
jgi:hypothetical protein